ncbi:MAG TPA: C25 family cysteine peptidase, partial [Pyrinomonadaceae bacterium]|nr:C25 family cysteine peptidase [Pyrinomonadaceae bacterium]
SDPIKQLWVAAQPGVKIGVKSEGFYRVSRADLQTAGFDVNAPTARWQLYVNGTEQAITVGNNGGYIEFYGKGIDRLESDTQIYFLVVGPENGKRIGATSRRRVGSDSVLSESYLQSFSKRERFFYTSSIFNGDAENVFGTPISQTTPSTVNFDLSGVDFNVAGSSIDIAIQGASLISHQTKVTLNNVEIGVITGNGHEPSSKRFEFSTSVLREGANSLKFTPLNGSGDTSYFNSLKVTYARRYQTEQNRISFHVPNYKGSYAGNFTSSNIRVFDTTNPAAPVLITGLPVEENGGGYRVFLPSNRGRVMYAVEDSAVLQPASITSNAASTLSTPAHQADLIILSHKKFLAQAEEWGSYRRQQGMKVEVIDIADVYDEFNFGVTHADSIRTFLQYAKSNWQIAPNYVLLIGDATFDPKNYFGLNANYVSTRFVDTEYSETGSDETMADFNDDGLAEIAIGRIPARETEEVTRIFNKLKTFELSVQTGLNRGALFAYDLPIDYDFQAISIRISSQLSPNIPRAFIGRDMPNAQTQLLGAMNNGPFIVNYSGHGNVGVWAASNFFSSANAGQLTNSNLSMF